MKLKRLVKKPSKIRFLVFVIFFSLAGFLVFKQVPRGHAQESVSPSPSASAASVHNVCPAKFSSGPTAGKDTIGEIASSLTEPSTAGENANLAEEEYSGTLGEISGLGKTANPGGTNPSISFNTCHGSSACHPSEIYHHGVYQNRGHGDAIDITPSNKMCYAAFSGTATSGGSGRNTYTKVISANGRVSAYYYHTTNKKNGAVQAGDIICNVGAGGIGHIHFELLVDGKSVNGDLSKRSNEPAYMRSLWANMKKVLGL